MLNVAPWHALKDADDMDAAPGRSMVCAVFAGIDTGRSADGTFKLTPVVVQPEWPASGVIVPLPETLTSETVKLFGFVTLKTTSPVPPGNRGVDGVPAVATVTVCIVAVPPAPVPEPPLAKYP
jgi:hypothetical protein